MTFYDWMQNTYKEVREDGWEGVNHALYQFYTGMWRRAGRVYNYGTPIYDENWDLLVILDACRHDLMDEVVDEYDWMIKNEEFVSVGSSSPEWMEKNFTREYAAEMASTAYVTGNVFSEEYLDPDDFLVLDEVWKYEWDDEIGIIHPEPLTDRAIQVGREYSPDRMIVHYMQPHTPYLQNPFGKGVVLDEVGENRNVPFDLLRRGKLSKERHWELYRENLRTVLDVVETLLENVDAEDVVITADHGNLFGEFGLYGHPRDVPLKTLKTVPWVRTTAEDTGEYDPNVSKPEPRDEHSVDRKLRDLGYIE